MRVTFYARVADVALIDLLEFYREDVEILRELGHVVNIHNEARSAVSAPADLLYAWWWPTALPVLAAARLRGIPSICTGAVDANNPLISPAKRRLKFSLTTVATKLVSANLAISDYERESLSKWGAKVETVHLSVDLTSFQARPKTNHPTATMIAQINDLSIRRKGVDSAVAAARIVRERVPDFELVLIGPSDAGGTTWLTQHVSPDSGVRYVGRVDRLTKARLLGESWLYLQPSVYEGFGLAVAEAMASGCYPIVTRAGSLPEVVGDCGSYVPAGDARALAASILESLRTDDLAERQRAGAEHASRFSRSARSERLHAVIQRVVRES